MDIGISSLMSRPNKLSLLTFFLSFLVVSNTLEATHMRNRQRYGSKLEKKYDLVVNIQGDEPLIEPEIIDGVVKALQVLHYCNHLCFMWFRSGKVNQVFPYMLHIGIYVLSSQLLFLNI
ncbi:unnamed protein product [Brassica napus]|uniref:(rape) hypothetical protein n=1 Tax=Brassica napus TaxID=3708 RepID=A0A816JJQ9_BRANA|nr:unnamed protein product [Brassica napus]